MTKQRNVLTIFLVGVVVLSLISSGPVYATSDSGLKNNFFSGLVEIISKKFGLDKDQVQTTIKQFTDQKQVERKKNMSDRQNERLDQLVKEGKITTAQKQAIIDELAALKKKYDPENLRNLTQEERKQTLQNEQDELKSWAKSQGIDVQYILLGFGMGKGFMMKRGGMWK